MRQIIFILCRFSLGIIVSIVYIVIMMMDKLTDNEWEGVMTITAKYNGKCSKCGGRINAGETIEWEKGSGASHVTCPEHKTETLKTVSVPAELTRIEYMVGYGSTGALYRECGDRTDEF